MAIVSTRPGLKIRVPVKFPARVTATSPLLITQTGASFNFSIDTVSLLGGGVEVWKVRVALKDAGLFDTVEAHSGFAVNPGAIIYEAWTNGGVKTVVGDDLYDAIVAAIGAPQADAAYSNATAITL